LSGTKGAFTVWDLKTLQPLMSSTRQTAALLSLQFAVDGNHLLSVDPYNAVFWDVRSQILVDIVPLDKGALFSAASLGSDWTEAWLGTAQHGVQWWTIRGGPTPLFRHSRPQHVSAVAFQRMQRLGAAGTAGGKVYLYALRKDERRLLVSKRLSKQSIHKLVFHPKKRELAVISGGAIALVDKKLKPLATVIHHNIIQTAHFSPDGATLAFAGEEGEVLLWERKSRKVIRRYKGCKGMIRALSFAPAAPILAGACTDGFVYLWNRTTSSPLAQLATLPNKEWLVRIKGNRFLGSQKALDYFRLRKGEQLFPLTRWGKALFAKDAGKETMKAVLASPQPIKR
jgi:WD40 repeat protein